MKKRKKFLGVMAVAAVLAFGTMPVAAEGNLTDMPQMTITTDKEEYNEGDSIKETISVENTTGKTIRNVTIEGNIPAGYSVNGSKDTTWKMIIKTLAPDEKVEKKMPDFVSAQTENEKEPEKNNETGSSNQNVSAAQNQTAGKNETTTGAGTGDSTQTVLWFFLAAVSIIVCAAIVRTKITKRLLSLLLAVMLAGGVFSGLETVVNAAEGTVLKTQEVTKTVKAGGKEVTLKVKMSYMDEEQTEDYLTKEGYKEVWREDFNGNSLNRSDWNVDFMIRVG